MSKYFSLLRDKLQSGPFHKNQNLFVNDQMVSSSDLTRLVVIHCVGATVASRQPQEVLHSAKPAEGHALTKVDRIGDMMGTYLIPPSDLE